MGENSFLRGKFDITLFIKSIKHDILIIQMYINDIIFGSINEYLCKELLNLMKGIFEMSMRRELTFFLGLSETDQRWNLHKSSQIYKKNYEEVWNEKCKNS